MADAIQVVVRFSITQDGLTFSDAIVMDAAAYAALTTDQVAAMQQARFDAWHAIVTTPPEPPPTPLGVALAALQDRKAQALASMQYQPGGAGPIYTVTLTTTDLVNVMAKMQVLAASPGGTTCTWEIVDNVFLTWSIADLQALMAAGAAYIQGCYDNAAALAGAISAAPDPGSVDITVGWP